MGEKNGAVLFKTGTSGVIFEVTFKNAYCTKLYRSIVVGSGLNTALILSPEIITINGVEFDNNWIK